MNICIRVLSLIGLVLSATTVSSRATPLDLVPWSTAPVFGAFGVEVTYNADTHSFLASGETQTYDREIVNFTPLSGFGLYSVRATISNDGLLESGGALDIQGDLGLGAGTETLLSGSLTTLGYPDAPGGNNFEFLFTVTGGSVMSDFGGLGGTGQIIIEAYFNGDFGDHPFTGSWAGSFDNTSSGYFVADANTALPVPEPSSISLVLIGLSLLGGAIRRRRSLKG